jgi:hypothetical protein
MMAPAAGSCNAYSDRLFHPAILQRTTRFLLSMAISARLFPDGAIPEWAQNTNLAQGS